MKIIKNIFSISLINFALLTLVLFYFSGRQLVPPPVVPAVPTPISTSTPAPPLAGRCIITVDGSRYDVTVFRSMHSGGDVFTCGADMSQLFHSQHARSYLSIMSRYKI